MIYVMIVGLIGIMGLVVWAVIRGLHAFANVRPEEVDENGVPKSLTIQNDMMWARVKWQAIAIVVVALIMVMAGTGGSS